MKKRYIKLSPLEEKFLGEWKKHNDSEGERDRAHAILLSNKGYSIAQLSGIFEVRRATIGEWFDRWEKAGLNGLPDAIKSGNPGIFTLSEKKKLY